MNHFKKLWLVTLALCVFAGSALPSGAITLSSSGGSTVTSPATGAGTDTCTGDGCAIGPVGISTDGGITLRSSNGASVINITVPNATGYLTVDNLTVAGPEIIGSTLAVNSTLTAGTALVVGSTAEIGTAIYLGPGGSSIATFIYAKPTLTSFGGTGTSITGSGTSFVINVGTGSPGSSGTLTFATTATNGYNCVCYDETASPLTQTKASSDTTTTCVITNYTVATGSAANWTASDKIHCIAAAY